VKSKTTYLKRTSLSLLSGQSLFQAWPIVSLPALVSSGWLQGIIIFFQLLKPDNAPCIASYGFSASRFNGWWPATELLFSSTRPSSHILKLSSLRPRLMSRSSSVGYEIQSAASSIAGPSLQGLIFPILLICICRACKFSVAWFFLYEI